MAPKIGKEVCDRTVVGFPIRGRYRGCRRSSGNTSLPSVLRALGGERDPVAPASWLPVLDEALREIHESVGKAAPPTAACKPRAHEVRQP